MAFEIQKGVPIPPSGTRYPGLTDALRKMKDGDSVFVEGGEHRYIGGYLYNIVGKKFRQKQIIEEGVKGIRIWCEDK